MRRKRLMIGVLVAAILGLVFYLVRPYFEIDRWVSREKWLRDQIIEHPISATALGFVVYFFASLIPGTGGKSVAYGWLFGFWRATIISSFALTGAGTISFLLSRYFLRDNLSARLDKFRERVNEAIDRDGAFYLFAIRVLHVPYSAVNYVMGTTSMSVSTFWWSTQLGMLPGTMVFVYAGSRLPTLAKLSEEGVHAFLTLETILALALLGVFPFIAKYVMRWFSRSSVDTAESGP